MPNWAGSCWYYLRYLDPGDDQQFVDPALEAYWMGPRTAGDVGGVDLYVGGVEHAVLHLLYARFWHKVLFDLGHVSSEEPFRRLVNQGYISAYAYTDARGFYVPAAEVVERDGGFFHEGNPVDREYGKIGKSLKNMVTPDEMIGAYGADTFRVYEMSTGPLEQSRPVGHQGRGGLPAPAAAGVAGGGRRGRRVRYGPRTTRRRRRRSRCCTGPSTASGTGWRRCGSTSRSPGSPS